MKVKNRVLEELMQVMLGYGQDEGIHRKFSYALVRNKAILQPHFDAIAEAKKEPETWVAFERLRLQLCSDYSHKDEAGNPVLKPDQMQGSVFDIVEETKPEFEEKMKELIEKEEHKEAVLLRQKTQAEARELLEEEVEVDFYQIKEDFFPEKISPYKMELLLPLIKEDD